MFGNVRPFISYVKEKLDISAAIQDRRLVFFVKIPYINDDQFPLFPWSVSLSELLYASFITNI